MWTPWMPTSVAYGIRHERLFGSLGRAGEAIDAVIALQGTGNVPRKSLTRIGWPDQVTAMIVDDDEHYRLTFNIDGIILAIDLDEVQMSPANARDMFIDIVNTALPITNPGRKINRIGLVETYDHPLPTPGEIAASVLTRFTHIGQPVDFALRSAFRRSLPGEDWWNTILQVVATKSDHSLESPDILRVSIDCQHYLVPGVVFSSHLVRNHYGEFYHAAESLQAGQLAGLEAPRSAVSA